METVAQLWFPLGNLLKRQKTVEMISSADKTLTYDELSKLVFKGILGDKTCEWAQVCM